MTTTDTLRARVENKPGLRGATSITIGGVYFDYIDPKPEQIDIMDIAHALSMQCRYNGHVTQFYSVAQHSVLVSRLVEEVEPAQALPALLHDAAEAYIGDMVGPLKQLCLDYKAVEHRVEEAVLAKFGLSLPLHPCIKHADLRMLRTEQRDLTAGAGDNWSGLDAYEPMAEQIVPLDWVWARQLFLDRYFELVAR